MTTKNAQDGGAPSASNSTDPHTKTEPLTARERIAAHDAERAFARQSRVAAPPPYDHCAEPHPGSERVLPCWYPKDHTTPHSWQSIYPGETWTERDNKAFAVIRPAEGA